MLLYLRVRPLDDLIAREDFPSVDDGLVECLKSMQQARPQKSIMDGLAWDDFPEHAFIQHTRNTLAALIDDTFTTVLYEGIILVYSEGFRLLFSRRAKSNLSFESTYLTFCDVTFTVLIKYIGSPRADPALFLFAAVIQSDDESPLSPRRRGLMLLALNFIDK